MSQDPKGPTPKKRPKSPTPKELVSPIEASNLSMSHEAFTVSAQPWVLNPQTVKIEPFKPKKATETPNPKTPKP